MMRKRTDQRGVTLIEVMLTLAISTLLLASILVGRNSLRSQAQFSDGMESIKETVLVTKSQANTSNNKNGIGTAQIGTGGQSRYLTFGKSIRFTRGSNRVTSATVMCYATNYACNGQLNITEVTNTTLPWNMKYTGYTVDGTAGTATEMTLVFGRNDQNGAAFTGAWYPAIITNRATQASVMSNQSPVVLNFESSDGRKGTVTVNPGAGTVTRQVL